jgi:anti-sigma factor RsiW
MHTDTSDTPDTQLEAYALGALDPADRAAVEQALAESPERRAELRRLREVVALLPYAVAPADPPDHVRARLFERIAASRPAASPPPARRPARLMPAAMAALAALLIALGGLTLSLGRQVAGLDRSNRQLVDTLGQMEQILAQTQARQSDLAAQLTTSGQELRSLSAQLKEDQYVISFVSAPGVAVHDLRAASATLGARGEMYMYPGEASAVVIFSGLPALGPGQVYQFWLADESSQVPGGTFAADEIGMATLVVVAPREVNAFRQVMLTVEPAGGSVKPGQQVLLQGSL